MTRELRCKIGLAWGMRAGSSTFAARPLLLAVLFAFLAVVGWRQEGMALSDTPNPNTWVTDGSVNAVVAEGDTVYLGGQFRHVMPYSGSAVPIDTTTGAPLATYPKVNGMVFAVVPDGSGGWYLGGSFFVVGAPDRQNLVHILAGGILDNSWAPNPDYSVEALTISGATLYVGGSFNTIGGEARNRLAAFDTATGNVLPWNPNVSGGSWGGQVLALAVSDSTIYAGGNFTSVGGQPRNHLAALNAVTGDAIISWNPNPSGGKYQTDVLVLAVSGSTVYVGGDFTSIGGQLRNYLAALDATTGLATAWNPDPNNAAYALAVSGSTVYAGGYFSTIGGQARQGVAALDDTNGLASTWNPDGNGPVTSLRVSGSTLYVGGFFSTIGGQSRNRLAAFDIAAGLTSWNPGVSGGGSWGGQVAALAVSNGTVYACGDFTSIGGQPRNNLAALDAATGAVISWDPDANGTINALAVSGSTVYVGGQFTEIGGMARNRIAAVDAATGVVSDWDPDTSGPVNALAVSGSTVYVGGYFSSIGGQSRNNIAALDATTGNATPWDPDAGTSVYWVAGQVRALAINGSTVYAGGDFTIIGGEYRYHIAALDAGTGNATDWDPDSSGRVYALALSGSTVYVGGYFSSIGGQSRNNIAALDATSGLATDWDPEASAGYSPRVNALAVSGSRILAGGYFTEIGGQTRNHLAALDAATGLATAWNPNVGPSYLDPEVHALAVRDSRVYAGGSFNNIGDKPQPYFAQFDGAENTGYAISGKVTSGEAGLAGVTVSLTQMLKIVGGADSAKTTTTDSNGNYTFTGLAEGSYTITTARVGYVFAPPEISVDVVADVIGQDFTATWVGFAASGTVTSGGSGLAGVTVSLSDGATRTTTTASDGTYTFTGLADGKYTITPDKPGCTFMPASRTIDVAGVDVKGQDFELASGSLKVNVTPKGAVTAGARWKVDNGAWKPSGAKVTKLAVGSHTITFKSVPGWITPEKQTVNLEAGKTTLAGGLYQSLGAEFSGSPTSGKTGLKVKFTDESSGPVKSWLWDFGDGSSSKVQNPLHAYNQPGTYTVRLAIKNGSCSSTKTRTDYVTIYAAPTADFSADPASGKKPLSVQFTDQSVGTVTSWLWTFGDEGTSTERNPTHVYSKTGTYTVKLKVTGPGGSNTKIRTGYIKVQK